METRVRGTQRGKGSWKGFLASGGEGARPGKMEGDSKEGGMEGTSVPGRRGQVIGQRAGQVEPLGLREGWRELGSPPGAPLGLSDGQPCACVGLQGGAPQRGCWSEGSGRSHNTPHPAVPGRRPGLRRTPKSRTPAFSAFPPIFFPSQHADDGQEIA